MAASLETDSGAQRSGSAASKASHRVMVVALALTMGCAGFVASTSVARASGSAMINQAAQKCLDDPSSSKSSGLQMQVWTCVGVVNQDWTTINMSDGSGRFLDRNNSSGLCLDTWQNGAANSTKAVQWPCNYTFGDSGELMYWWFGRMFNDHGNCLDDANSGTSNGNKVDWYTCNGTAAQNWTGGYY